MISTQATPSSSALWASIGPTVTSPMAHTPGTVVAKAWVGTKPRSSNFTVSRPSSPTNGRRPTATSTTSASIAALAPSLRPSTSTDTPASVAVAWLLQHLLERRRDRLIRSGDDVIEEFHHLDL